MPHMPSSPARRVPTDTDCQLNSPTCLIWPRLQISATILLSFRRLRHHFGDDEVLRVFFEEPKKSTLVGRFGGRTREVLRMPRYVCIPSPAASAALCGSDCLHLLRSDECENGVAGSGSPWDAKTSPTVVGEVISRNTQCRHHVLLQLFHCLLTPQYSSLIRRDALFHRRHDIGSLISVLRLKVVSLGLVFPVNDELF